VTSFETQFSKNDSLTIANKQSKARATVLNAMLMMTALVTVAQWLLLYMQLAQGHRFPFSINATWRPLSLAEANFSQEIWATFTQIANILHINRPNLLNI
jgi:hypothetical protein